LFAEGTDPGWLPGDRLDPSGASNTAVPAVVEAPGAPRRGRWVKRVIYALALPLVFYLGILTQFHLGPTFDAAVAPALFTQPTTTLDARTLNEIWQIMQRNYAKAGLSGADAFDAASKGLVHGLPSAQYGDDFSAYRTPAELKADRAFLAGSFGGIGATMSSQAGKLVISRVLPSTPAQQAGLQANDVVVTIDGQTTTGLTVDQAVNKIRGNVGTHVRLGVLRNAAVKEFDIVRATIIDPSVESKDVAPGVLYIRITKFAENTADNFHSALNAGLGRGDTKVVLDLRENPGGFVTAADNVVSEFVKSGLSTTLVGRDGKKEEHRVTGNGLAYSQPVVVLVDSQTASAAEITAGALKDNHRARIIGDKTFGKGSVQTDFPVSNGGDVHLTIAFWYTPSGRSIQRDPGNPNSGGIVPDQAVALDKPEHFFDIQAPNSDPAVDTQLQAALAAVR
jgi:carboxyl-terminal processing protease